MKKLFTLAAIAVALLSQNASAQIKKGETMLGGSIGFSTSSSKNTFSDGTGTSTGFSILPQLGVGLGNNWILGLNAGYGHNKSVSKGNFNEATSKTNSYLIGVSARKFHPLSTRFGIFGEGGGDYNYNRSKSKVTNQPESGAKGNMWTVYVRPGAYVRATNRFIIETTIGSIGYSRAVSKTDGASGKNISNYFGLGVNTTFMLGFKVVL